MILQQYVKHKKKFQSNIEISLTMQFLVEQLKSRGFQVKIHDNQIDFDYIPGFTTNYGINTKAAFRLLRHGSIVLIENHDIIQIRCVYSIRYVFVMSICFGLAMLGLNILYSEGKILNSILILIITFGFIFGIGLISLWINVKNLIKE